MLYRVCVERKFMKFQRIFCMDFFGFIRISQGQYGLNLYSIGNIQQIFNIGIGTDGAVMVSFPDLYPATAQADIMGGKMNEDGSDGGILNPNITL